MSLLPDCSCSIDIGVESGCHAVPEPMRAGGMSSGSGSGSGSDDGEAAGVGEGI
jgi:hypothetical protein